MVIASSPAISGLAGLEVGQPAERQRRCRRRSAGTAPSDRQARLFDARLQIDAFALGLLVEVGEALGDLLLLGGAVGDGRRATLPFGFAIAWRR